MTTADTTSAGTTKVSLRDLSEAAFRALTAHGASHGEARAAARWCFRPSCTVGADWSPSVTTWRRSRGVGRRSRSSRRLTDRTASRAPSSFDPRRVTGCCARHPSRWSSSPVAATSAS